ncbi:tRNA pseudouridine synthase A [Candidatus Moranella endobia PCVAL]|uniref:tRNA pseudouridine synthase A n=1 Tax=Moranella endobia (strain PCIT) TaxID=903503 RepID=F7XY19_MOREP|nr:tRNA pseudouridine(38-40) synthase TruA [Candidatus Moranella endobia]AEI74995.1 tRNA pseudouridine synthase A [Candidatus Moranella endobia PCIT]AGJ61243.1 tRNA pseudouridine synthase A [Candidatus Moranella endobia PCVAL]
MVFKMKLALGIEYNGSAYSGWQRQPEAPSVQACLERALSIVANAPVIVHGAGRTDAGVHATGQVVHFETWVRRPESAWTLGVNANLPADITVRWVVPVAKEFHARFSATTRCYYYVIYNHRLRPALVAHGLAHYGRTLDATLMARSSQCLWGENNFTSFRSLKCQSRSPWRNVHHLHVKRQGNYVMVDIKANAFVHHMVRNIVGSLLEVGCGKRPESWIAELLFCRDRTQAGATAQAKGLYLVAVEYPSRFSLPTTPQWALFPT